MPMIEATPAYRILTSRTSLSGSDGLTAINTIPLNNGALLLAAGVLYQLRKTSAAVPDGGNVLSPAAGPGRWHIADQNLGIFNVVNFGADPTGATDSTAAIQAAVTAAIAVGGEVFWPAGTYTAAGPLANLRSVRHSGPGVLVLAGVSLTLDPGVQALHYGDIRLFGGVEGAADNTAARDSARAYGGEDKPVVVPEGDYGATTLTAIVNPYNVAYVDSLGPQWLIGTAADPTDRAAPVIWVEKVSDATRAVNPSEYDQGAAYLSCQMHSDAYGCTSTSYMRAVGSGQVVAHHARARTVGNAAAQIWGVWAYVDTAGAEATRAIGVEVDCRNASGVAPAYDDTAVIPGWLSGLTVGMVDSITPGIGHEAIGISNATGVGWLCGINIRSDVIQPIDANGNGEAICLQGATLVADAAGGLRIGRNISGAPFAPHFEYGLKTSEGTFVGNKAVWLADGQYVAWGGFRRIRFESTGVFHVDNGVLDLTAAGGEVRISGTKVVDARLTGWTAATGSATRTTYDTTTVTTAQLAERVKALIDDLMSHGLIGT